MKKFINVSNHNSDSWCEKQLREAEKYGEIVDLPFPMIDPHAENRDVSLLAEEYYNRIKQYEIGAVMVQGEFTFSYALIKRLRKDDIVVVAASTERITEETINPDKTVQKTSVFSFSNFRKYE